MTFTHTIPLSDPDLLAFDKACNTFISHLQRQVETSFIAAGHGKGASEDDDHFRRRLRITMMVNGWLQVTRGVLESTGRHMPEGDLAQALGQFAEIQSATLRRGENAEQPS